MIKILFLTIKKLNIKVFYKLIEIKFITKHKLTSDRFNLSPFTKDYRDLGFYVHLFLFEAHCAFLTNKQNN